jgi:hypothetical protein
MIDAANWARKKIPIPSPQLVTAQEVTGALATTEPEEEVYMSDFALLVQELIQLDK